MFDCDDVLEVWDGVRETSVPLSFFFFWSVHVNCFRTSSAMCLVQCCVIIAHFYLAFNPTVS